MLRAGQIQGEGSIVFGVQTKLEPLLFGASDKLTSRKNGLEMRKAQPLKGKGVKELKKTNHQTLPKPVSEHSKKFSYVAMLLLELKNNV